LFLVGRSTPRVDLTTFRGQFQTFFRASAQCEIDCDFDRKRLTLLALSSSLLALRSSPRTAADRSSPARPSSRIASSILHPASSLLFSATYCASVSVQMYRYRPRLDPLGQAAHGSRPLAPWHFIYSRASMASAQRARRQVDLLARCLKNRSRCAKHRGGVLRTLAVSRDSVTSGPRTLLFAPCSSLISPHQERVLPHPRGEIRSISPHPHSPTGEPQTTCAGKVGRNSQNFAPREKEKNFSGAKIRPAIQAVGAFELWNRVSPKRNKNRHRCSNSQTTFLISLPMPIRSIPSALAA
jgi:hypothetical protein